MSGHICLFVYLFSDRKVPGVNVNSVNFRGTLVLLGFKVDCKDCQLSNKKAESVPIQAIF